MGGDIHRGEFIYFLVRRYNIQPVTPEVKAKGTLDQQLPSITAGTRLAHVACCGKSFRLVPISVGERTRLICFIWSGVNAQYGSVSRIEHSWLLRAAEIDT